MNTIIPKAGLLLVAFGLAHSAPAGDITGRVTLKGAPPPEQTVDLKSEPYTALAAKHPKGLRTRRYQVGPEGGLQQVLVYIRGDFTNTTFAPPTTTPVLDHADGFFQPYVQGLRTGQPLQFKCSDETLCTFTGHPKANDAFALSIPRGSDGVARAFTKPEVAVKFKDDMHPWNHAFVGVFAHPFFAVTDAQGRFLIRGVPAGNYTLEIFHPRSGTSAKAITVADGTAAVDFEITPAR